MKRVSASAWVALSFALVAQAAGCEGESTSNGDDGPGRGGDAGGGGDEPATGGTGRGGSAGFGGDAGRGPMGGTGNSSSGGTAGDGGAGTAGDAGNAGEGQGGDPAGGAAGAAGAGGDGPDDTSVHGRVVDFWLAPLARVPVTIGTITTETNAQGEFSVASVAPRYDVALVASWSTGVRAYGWYFEGLTRRDPTLQVYKGRDDRYGDFQVTTENATLDDSRTLSVALGGPYGSSQFYGVEAAGLISNLYWVGPETMQATAHGLLWELDSNELPIAYHAHATSTATLDSVSATDAMFLLNLADTSITSGTVSGTVTSSVTSGRSNYVFVRFSDGAAITAVEDYPPPDAFSYVAPEIPQSTLIVAASHGFSTTARAVAHRDGVAVGQSGVSLTLPSPVTPIAPVPAFTGVNSATQFNWTGGGNVHVLHVEDRDAFRGLFVVTSRRSLTLPSVPGFSLRSGVVHTWEVETHGSAASVDAFAGPQGGLDSFSGSFGTVAGPKTGDGSYAASAPRGFTTAAGP